MHDGQSTARWPVDGTKATTSRRARTHEFRGRVGRLPPLRGAGGMRDPGNASRQFVCAWLGFPGSLILPPPANGRRATGAARCPASSCRRVVVSSRRRDRASACGPRAPDHPQVTIGHRLMPCRMWPEFLSHQVNGLLSPFSCCSSPFSLLLFGRHHSTPGIPGGSRTWDGGSGTQPPGRR
jgi:hypothetical protein